MSGDDLVARVEDAFGVRGLRTGPNGVIEWPINMTFDEWCDLGMVACAARDFTGWFIGDWVNFGEATYGEKYTQAEALTGRSYGGLRNLAYVARHVPRSRRHPLLSFTHHYHVAALEPDEQEEWLSRAEAEGWSADLLASTLRDARGLVTSSDTGDDESPWQLQLDRPSLRDVAAEIVATPADEHGRVCIGSNQRERLRRALNEEPTT